MKLNGLTKQENCFFENDPHMALARRATAEGVGTLLLMFAASGSGLAAQHLSPHHPFIGLIASAIAIAGALVGLINAFGAVSGGHFNPLITALQWLGGQRKLDCTLVYISSQIAGGIIGALLANAVFRSVRPSLVASPGLWSLTLSELIVSAGLMIVVFGCIRSGKVETAPFAVGTWLTAAIIASPSASYANPAVTVGALFSAGPIALSSANVLAYVSAEIVGAILAFLIIMITYPRHVGFNRPVAEVKALPKDVLP
jgi:glycerol uptake facilitator-like aquaporin